jgi:hypothetical protein
MRFNLGWEKIEGAVGASDEAVEAGSDKDRCSHWVYRLEPVGPLLWARIARATASRKAESIATVNGWCVRVATANSAWAALSAVIFLA